MLTIAGGILIAVLCLVFAEILIPLAVIAAVLYGAFWLLMFLIALIATIPHH